jgi:hypothetical protein
MGDFIYDPHPFTICSNEHSLLAVGFICIVHIAFEVNAADAAVVKASR